MSRLLISDIRPPPSDLWRPASGIWLPASVLSGGAAALGTLCFIAQMIEPIEGVRQSSVARHTLMSTHAPHASRSAARFRISAVSEGRSAQGVRNFIARGAAVLCGVLLLAGCSHVPTGAVQHSAPTAHLVISNETTATWQVSVSAGDRLSGAWRILPGSTVAAEVPAGSLVIQQVLLSGDAGSGESRSFPMQLAAEETYRWRLVTLLSTRPGELTLPVLPAPNP